MNASAETLSFTPGQKVVFEGDSATHRGAGATKSTWPYLRLMNWDRTWADHLSELLFCWRPDLKLEFINAATGGATCRKVMSRLEDIVLPAKPGWVISTTGGNDARVGVPLEEYAETYRSYCTRLNDECGTQVLFIGHWSFPVDRPKKMQPEVNGAYYDALESVCAELPFAHFARMADALTEKARLLKEQFEGHTLFTGPDNHYNAVAHIMIAGEILKRFGIVTDGA